LIKTDREGNEIWSRTYGDIFLEYGYSLIPLGDGNYALAGWTSSWGQGFWDMLLLKVDTSGNEIETAYRIKETPDRGFLTVGYTSSFGSGFDDIYLVKLDPRGIYGVEEDPGRT